MSVWSRMARKRTLRRNRQRRVDEMAGYDWSKIHHNRIEIINRAVCNFGHERTRYLEIGCLTNACFSAVIADHKVGVDPVSGGTIRATSDEFFRTNNEIFDVIFVDGYHDFAQTRRDVMNGLACLRTGGLIFCHDMLPNSWIEELPLPLGGFFCGDIWKVAHELAGASGLTYRTVVADHGVAAIRKDADNPTYPDEFESLAGRDFRYYLENREKMRLVDFDEYVATFLAKDPAASVEVVAPA